jgi:hypothetical protein
MRRMSIAILSSAILFIAACASQPTSQPPAAAARATLYERARLITGDEAPPIEDSAFVVQDGKFTLVGRRGQVQAPEGAARVDLTGKTVMPGVIEAHAHLRVVPTRTRCRISSICSDPGSTRLPIQRGARQRSNRWTMSSSRCSRRIRTCR